MLGQAPGVFAGGEIWHVWERAVLAGGRCGCGRPFRECPVWSAVFADGFGGVDEDLARTMVDRYRHMRTRHLPMAASRWSWPVLLRRTDPYAPTLERLYTAIARVTGARLVVDASKDPLYGFVLRSRRPAVDVRVVHLVRDPRAAAHSWTRTKREWGYDGERFMPTYRPAMSTTTWAVLNEAAAAFGRRHRDRYLLVRYEDLAARPREAVERIGRFAGVDFGGAFAGDRTVSLDPTHSVWGNPDRFGHADVTFRVDEEWRSAMRRRDAALVTAMTAPWLRRWRYPLRAGW